VSGDSAPGRRGADLIEEGLLADDRLFAHHGAKFRPILLGQHLHIRRILLDECGSDLNRHWSFLR
jgi:hypothetical protein